MTAQCCACREHKEIHRNLLSFCYLTRTDRYYPYCELCWVAKQPKGKTPEDYVRWLDETEQDAAEQRADLHTNQKTENAS